VDYGLFESAVDCGLLIYRTLKTNHMLASLSWKNIWRNKTRSLIIIFAIVFGVIGGVGFTAFYKGLISQRLEMAIGNEVSNIQIHNPNFQNNKEINDTIAGISNLTAVLDTFKRIKAYSVRLKCVTMISSANSNEGIMVNGIDPEKEKSVTGIYKYVREGEYLSGARRNGILLGQKLAQKLKVRLRSKVVLTMQTTSGNITYAACKVVGIYKTNNTTFDERNAYVKKTDLAPIIGLDDMAGHEIAISVYSDLESDGISASLTNKLDSKNLNIQTWKEIMPELGAMNQASDYVLYIFMIIIFLALSFGIINTMLMAVLDRVREIGMLMAIGMNKRKIFLMIMYETILLMLTGSLVGLGIVYFMINFFGKHGIDLSNFAVGLSSIGFSSMVYPSLGLAEYLKIVILVMAAGVLSSLVPARKALRLNPSEAIRTQ